MDMRMPVMDGHQSTLHIKGTSKGQNTVIIALTATAFEEERERVLFEGCDDFVRKPFYADDIYDMLIKHLGVKFIYEELETLTPLPTSSGPQEQLLSSEDLDIIPLEILSELKSAAIEADLTRILELIDQVSDLDPEVADQLGFIARNFEYQKLMSLLEQTRGAG
jgi:CheY-like chemotaxis protein